MWLCRQHDSGGGCRGGSGISSSNQTLKFFWLSCDPMPSNGRRRRCCCPRSWHHLVCCAAPVLIAGGMLLPLCILPGATGDCAAFREPGRRDSRPLSVLRQCGSQEHGTAYLHRKRRPHESEAPARTGYSSRRSMPTAHDPDFGFTLRASDSPTAGLRPPAATVRSAAAC